MASPKEATERAVGAVWLRQYGLTEATESRSLKEEGMPNRDRSQKKI